MNMGFKKELIKFLPRKEQESAFNWIRDVKKKKPDNKYFLLNLPTGCGKSYLTMLLADWWSDTNKTKIDIITASKILQDQYSNTYESINNLKGRENYQCPQWSCSCAQGEEFNRLNKTECENCPYKSDRQSYLFGDLSLTNYYLYILFAMYKPDFIKLRKGGLLIVDEAHMLDDVMCEFVSMKITENYVKKLKLKKENETLEKLRLIKESSDENDIKEKYIEFLTEMLSNIIETISSLDNVLQSGTPTKIKRDIKIDGIIGTPNNQLKLLQNITDLESCKMKIDVFLKDYKKNVSNWVMEHTWNEKTKEKEISLEPIWSGDFLERYIWSRYDMVVLMSGTILDKNIFTRLNGMDLKKSAYYSINSPFPEKNRKVFYMPVSKMTFKNKEDGFKNMVPYINKILNKYSGSKGIIHTNSFELSQWIKNSIDNKRLLFHTSENKDEILELHKKSSDPTVLVSPSMSTGVSLDGDYSRFQLICKVPFPSLASQKNKMRLKLDPEVYAIKTCAEIIQSSGRSIRSIDDFADTIITDSSFSDVLQHNSQYFPKWWLDSIKIVPVKNTIN